MQELQVVIITGLSGAGRRTASHTMEDLGWYVVDNLPPELLPSLAETMSRAGHNRIAVVVDVRSRSQFNELPLAFDQLTNAGVQLSMVFLEARDDIIVQRQESSRRPLPLQGDGHLLDAIERERRLLADLRAAADIVVDTSRLTARQLSQRITNHFGDEMSDALHVSIISFGFKYGVPVDADIVFDVRFLPNPFWVPDLRPKTGLSPDVSAYVLKQAGAEEFLTFVGDYLGLVGPGYLSESKRQVTLAVGCTGGKHRSTSLSEELGTRLQDQGFRTTVMHRDIGKE